MLNIYLWQTWGDMGSRYDRKYFQMMTNQMVTSITDKPTVPTLSPIIGAVLVTPAPCPVSADTESKMLCKFKFKQYSLVCASDIYLTKNFQQACNFATVTKVLKVKSYKMSRYLFSFLYKMCSVSIKMKLVFHSTSLVSLWLGVLAFPAIWVSGSSL